MRKAVIFGVSQFSELFSNYLAAEKTVEIAAYTAINGCCLFKRRIP